MPAKLCFRGIVQRTATNNTENVLSLQEKNIFVTAVRRALNRFDGEFTNH